MGLGGNRRASILYLTERGTTWTSAGACSSAAGKSGSVPADSSGTAAVRPWPPTWSSNAATAKPRPCWRGAIPSTSTPSAAASGRGAFTARAGLGLAVRRPVIYRGLFATGFFQSLYRAAPAGLALMVRLPGIPCAGQSAPAGIVRPVSLFQAPGGGRSGPFLPGFASRRRRRRGWRATRSAGGPVPWWPSSFSCNPSSAAGRATAAASGSVRPRPVRWKPWNRSPARRATRNSVKHNTGPAPGWTAWSSWPASSPGWKSAAGSSAWTPAGAILTRRSSAAAGPRSNWPPWRSRIPAENRCCAAVCARHGRSPRGWPFLPCWAWSWWSSAVCAARFAGSGYYC